RMRRHRLPVIPVMVLFRPSKSAVDGFKTPALTFQCQLVKLWEMEASLLLQPGQPALWPLAALARNGLALAEKLDNLLHDSKLPSSERSDLLSIFAIFLGMRSKTVSERYIEKRRELMIESPVYEWIKDEGRIEGHAAAKRSDILELLENRFGKRPSKRKV